MAMHKAGDLVASVGKFKDAEGREAKRWCKVGVLMRDEQTGRMSIKLEAIPICPEWSGWLAVHNVAEGDH